MKRLFDSLTERDRRRYAAIEATKLGHGGIEYIAKILMCNPKAVRTSRIRRTEELDTGRVKKGGGRKRLTQITPTIEENFLKVLQDHTAGDPMRAEVKWTNLSRRQIAAESQNWGLQSVDTFVSTAP